MSVERITIIVSSLEKVAVMKERLRSIAGNDMAEMASIRVAREEERFSSFRLPKIITKNNVHEGIEDVSGYLHSLRRRKK